MAEPIQLILSLQENLLANYVVLTDIQWCCGAFMIQNLHKNPDPIVLDPDRLQREFYYHCKLNETIEDFAKRKDEETQAETKEQYRARIKLSLMKEINKLFSKKSYFLLILSEKEKEDILDIVLDCGFVEVIPKTSNPSGTYITLYVRHLLPRDKVPESIVNGINMRIALGL